MLNEQQYEQLLKPLNPSRVAKRQGGGRSLSYLEAWDVKAHLNRVFGFLNWSSDVQESALAFEEQNAKGQWHVGYKVTLTLSFPSELCTYTESAVGFASLPSRGEAHDMAIKTAESDALKRAAINLGTQFGLSLYNNGSVKDVVGATLDKGVSATTKIVEPEITVNPAPESEEAQVWIDEITAGVTAKDVPVMLDIKKRMTDNGVNDLVYQGVTLNKWLDKGIAKISSK